MFPSYAAMVNEIAILALFAVSLDLVLGFGGIGWLYGGVIGATVFRLMQDFLSQITPQYWTFWLGLFLVVLVLVGRDRLLKPWTWWRKGS